MAHKGYITSARTAVVCGFKATGSPPPLPLCTPGYVAIFTHTPCLPNAPHPLALAVNPSIPCFLHRSSLRQRLMATEDVQRRNDAQQLALDKQRVQQYLIVVLAEMQERLTLCEDLVC